MADGPPPGGCHKGHLKTLVDLVPGRLCSERRRRSSPAMNPAKLFTTY